MKPARIPWLIAVVLATTNGVLLILVLSENDYSRPSSNELPTIRHSTGMENIEDCVSVSFLFSDRGKYWGQTATIDRGDVAFDQVTAAVTTDLGFMGKDDTFRGLLLLHFQHSILWFEIYESHAVLLEMSIAVPFKLVGRFPINGVGVWNAFERVMDAQASPSASESS